LAEFLESGHYDRHLTRLRRDLRRRFAVAFEALGAEMPPGVTWTRPEGGYQIWVTLPPRNDARQLLPEAVRHGVLFVPGDQFYYPARMSRELRLTLAKTPEEQIRSGVRALGRAIRGAVARPIPQSAGVQL
jgi:2-aminoadipate transaminase